MLAAVPEAERPGAWDEIWVALGCFETANGFVGPWELLVASATHLAHRPQGPGAIPDGTDGDVAASAATP